MLKETKKGLMTIPHNIDSINKIIEIIKRNRIDIVELNNTITKMKNSLVTFELMCTRQNQ